MSKMFFLISFLFSILFSSDSFSEELSFFCIEPAGQIKARELEAYLDKCALQASIAFKKVGCVFLTEKQSKCTKNRNGYTCKAWSRFCFDPVTSIIAENATGRSKKEKRAIEYYKKHGENRRCPLREYKTRELSIPFYEYGSEKVESRSVCIRDFDSECSYKNLKNVKGVKFVSAQSPSKKSFIYPSFAQKNLDSFKFKKYVISGDLVSVLGIEGLSDYELECAYYEAKAKKGTVGWIRRSDLTNIASFSLLSTDAKISDISRSNNEFPRKLNRLGEYSGVGNSSIEIVYKGDGIVRLDLGDGRFFDGKFLNNSRIIAKPSYGDFCSFVIEFVGEKAVVVSEVKNRCWGLENELDPAGGYIQVK